MTNEKKTTKVEKASRIVENLDYYYEDGLMVLTARYLRNRGYCCGNGCRHCPYSDDEKASQKERL